jgi:hypothetical protein
MSALGAQTFQEDTAHASGDRGLMHLGVANITNANLSSADGDYTPHATTRQGFAKSQLESSKATFMACLATTTSLDATPTDFFSIRNTSASKVVKVLRIELQCSQTTVGDEEFFLIKRSTLNNTTNSNALTKVPLDSGQASDAGVEVRNWTSDPSSLGTAVGTVKTHYLTPGQAAPSTGVPHPLSAVLWDANLYGMPITLRGTTEELAINFAGTSLPSGGRWGVNIVWTEE